MGGEPARGYSWPPFQPGHQLSRKHGVWAADVDEEAAQVVGALYAPELVDRYPAMALLGATVWVRRRRALADIEQRGMVLFDKDGDEKAHPLLELVGRWERQLLDLSARFGLDPKSDADLQRSRAGAVAAGYDLDALKAKGREAIDARDAGDPTEEPS